MTSHRIAALVCASVAAGQLASSTPRTVDIGIDATSVEGRISPLLYGQFMEFMFEGIKYGLHAEMIRDRGFEDAPSQAGLPPSWKRYPDNRDDDYALTARRDDEVAYPDTQRSHDTTGGHSLRVDLKRGVIERHGVYQAGVPIRQAVEYRGYVWMRTRTFAGAVRIALEADVDGGRVYDEARIEHADGEWTRYTFALKPAASDPLARFAILFDGQGTVWIDQVSLMPGDAVNDVRADVFEKVKALHPAFIRWPGGNVAQDYRWHWGIGPRDARPTWINLSWGSELEPGDFGTNEFIQFARNAGAEPSITVNVEGRGATAAEAAAWVEYCNGPPTSKYGSMRVRDGHPDPYRVKYWEIGNEIWGDWVRGHSDADTYARNLGTYVTAMRAVDPSIEVIAVGDNDMAWNRTVIQRAGVPFEYLAIHHYYGRRDMQGDLAKLTARPVYYERFYDEVETFLRELPANRRPKLAINEWGLDLPESQQYSILSALYAARLMNVFERRGDLIAMSAVSDLVNGWPGGIIQAGRQSVFVTPIYLVNRLYASRLGVERLKTTVGSQAGATRPDASDQLPLDVVASRSKDGTEIYLKAVNTDLEHALTLRIRVAATRLSSTAIVERVTAESVTAVNGFATPDSVRTIRESVPAGSSFSLNLPKHSIMVVTLTAAR
jgi:alpha-N-arabinofuranosidase